MRRVYSESVTGRACSCDKGAYRNKYFPMYEMYGYGRRAVAQVAAGTHSRRKERDERDL